MQSIKEYVGPKKSSLYAMKNVNIEKIKPEIDPTQLFLGLILGRIFFSPNFVPKKKAAVSHSQTKAIKA